MNTIQIVMVTLKATGIPPIQVTRQVFDRCRPVPGPQVIGVGSWGIWKTVTICGRPYLTRDAVQAFLNRAAAGGTFQLIGGRPQDQRALLSTSVPEHFVSEFVHQPHSAR